MEEKMSIEEAYEALIEEENWRAFKWRFAHIRDEAEIRRKFEFEKSLIAGEDQYVNRMTHLGQIGATGPGHFTPPDRQFKCQFESNKILHHLSLLLYKNNICETRQPRGEEEQVLYIVLYSQNVEKMLSIVKGFNERYNLNLELEEIEPREYPPCKYSCCNKDESA